MNKGDITTHVGIVEESYADMSISVRVPAIAPQAIDQVQPEFVSPLRWRPREDDEVTIYQRLGALRPDQALTWVGWAYDDGNTHLVPPWFDPGMVGLFGADGRTVIVLDDDEHPSGDTSGPAGSCRIGRRDADEPLPLGNVYKASLERRIDLLVDIIDALDTWQAGLALVITALGGDISTINTAFKLAVHTSGVGTAVREQLVGATVPPGQDVKTLLPDHLSDYTFASKVPDPEPFTGEEEE